MRTFIKVVPQTYTDFPLRMRRHSKPCLPINILFTQILVFPITRVNNLDIHSLLFSWSDIRRYDDELVWMGGIPYAFCGRVFVRVQVKLDGMSWVDEGESKDS